MKIEYKGITGTAVKEVYFCAGCCFECLGWDCMPDNLHRCVNIFLKRVILKYLIYENIIQKKNIRFMQIVPNL